jgi:very-short-patch-repair endonuclease
MSPLSVSAFLKESNITFDTVIFDEASQVRIENSIGSIFRSNQYIIAGDKEQLPPTSFFTTNYDADTTIEEGASTITDYDSILELANGLLPSIKLKWHYRSKFEELIQPSNNEIYDDLITFPSSSKPSCYEGIKLIKVNGLYLKRSNEVEASRVVEVIKDILTKFGNRFTIGVVTFNTEQENLIERKISSFRKSNPTLSSLISDLSDPLFVKNIETVQGDERDIIIISISYGPDEMNKISMNFGPLNQANGYRRLNVAVTRSKTSLVLITSLTSMDIDLSKSSARGVKFLKQYLAYAEGNQLDSKIKTEENKAENYFEQDVYNKLTKLGYTVIRQLGCSSFKLDLAILDPSNNNTYLLGIQLDGSVYQSTPSIRDSDRLYKEALEARKWKVYRIWSTDYYRDSETQINNIVSILNNKEEESSYVSEVEIPVLTIRKEQEDLDFVTYPNYNYLLPKIDFLHNFEQNSEYLLSIINKLSPIAHSELKKIVPVIWQREIYSSYVQGECLAILQDLINKKIIKVEDEFIIKIDKPIVFRVCDTNSAKREMSCIHKEELSNGILKILKYVKKMNIDLLFSRIASYCGFTNVSSSTKTILTSILDNLSDQGLVKLRIETVEIVD